LVVVESRIPYEAWMRVITKETDYAIRAVVHLAGRPGALVTSAEISAEERIPLQFLRRILGRLLKAGLVTSREGVAGGVSLRAGPEEIRVLDIMRVFQGEVALSECMFRRRLCANRRTCVLRRHIREIEKTLADEFAAISIADLLREQTRGRARTRKRGGR
jgi:Rrf2 family cysteine metabolism transcriptional repressor